MDAGSEKQEGANQWQSYIVFTRKPERSISTRAPASNAASAPDMPDRGADRFEDGRIRVCDDCFFGCIACGHCMMVCPAGSVTVTGRGVSPDDLLPLPPTEQRATADSLAALMLSRRSVRRFADKEVEAELLDESWRWLPPLRWESRRGMWGASFVRGRGTSARALRADRQGLRGDAESVQALGSGADAPVDEAVDLRAVQVVHSPARPRCSPRASRAGKDLLFYDAPAIIIFHRSPYADAVDAAIACTYAMLAAESLGPRNHHDPEPPRPC